MLMTVGKSDLCERRSRASNATSSFFLELTSPRGKNLANTKPFNGPSHDGTSELYDAMWC